MKIYFAGSIAGGRTYLETYQKIVAYLKTLGHQILTEHVVWPDVLEWETNFTHQQVYTRDIQWLMECDCLIAEVSNPSLGVGYEICYGLRIGKPVLCVYQNETLLSSLILGNTSEGFQVKEYGDDLKLKNEIDEFLLGISV